MGTTSQTCDMIVSSTVLSSPCKLPSKVPGLLHTFTSWPALSKMIVRPSFSHNFWESVVRLLLTLSFKWLRSIILIVVPTHSTDPYDAALLAKHFSPHSLHFSSPSNANSTRHTPELVSVRSSNSDYVALALLLSSLSSLLSRSSHLWSIRHTTLKNRASASHRLWFSQPFAAASRAVFQLLAPPRHREYRTHGSHYIPHRFWDMFPIKEDWCITGTGDWKIFFYIPCDRYTPVQEVLL